MKEELIEMPSQHRPGYHKDYYKKNKETFSKKYQERLNSGKYICNVCEFKAAYPKDLKRHLNTKKHQKKCIVIVS